MVNRTVREQLQEYIQRNFQVFVLIFNLDPAQIRQRLGTYIATYRNLIQFDNDSYTTIEFHHNYTDEIPELIESAGNTFIPFLTHNVEFYVDLANTDLAETQELGVDTDEAEILDAIAYN